MVGITEEGKWGKQKSAYRKPLAVASQLEAVHPESLAPVAVTKVGHSPQAQYM